ncbi:MAG: flagellar motor switch phosphatase FliY [Gudongella sp.]|jgi:flagellar motor switch protein FliN/FliY|nr:flagellar motor switch phosphatase FliY [Gudongella sp.]
MSDNMISQEEIDALLSKGNLNEVSDMTEVEKDIMGEVGNISMSTAATTLSTILSKKVSITTPKVSWQPFGQVVEEFQSPKVVATVDFKHGLSGNNIFMVDVNDAAIIADLMMGGDGLVESSEMGELQQSAVAEAMNQMIGSASTAMATMIGKEIDINPPLVNLWELDGEYEIDGMDYNANVCKIEFDLSVEGLIESKIMQMFERETVDDIVSTMNEDFEEEVQPVVTPEPVVEPQSKEEKKPVPEEPVTVQKPIFNELAPSDDSGNSPRNLDLIMDVPLEFSVVLGKSKKTIKDILSFGNGSVVELNKQADEPLEIYVNGKLIAQGEVVVINENFGIRITNILSKEQRVRGLK